MKAQSNWEEKSQYLLREIVKYDLYIDSLQAAMSLRLKKRGEKGTYPFLFLLHPNDFFTSALERALSHSNPDEPFSSSSKWKELPIVEEAEPTTPGATARQPFPLNSHKRELAEVDDDVNK